MTKTLGDFIRNFSKNSLPDLDPQALHLPVTGVTSDSRQVKPGFIFVAIRGGSQDGHQFIPSAEQSGAILVVGEQDLSCPPKIPYLKVKDGRLALAGLAAEFYDYPSDSMLMVGVTGTSGKTTSTYLIEAILKSAGYQVGVLGTISFRFGAKVFPSTHTTPGPVELQHLLAQMKEEGCTAVVMEVSSHALKQRRAAFIAFDGMLFTNLSPEHLDFHPDMEDYFCSKMILFTELADYAWERGKNPFASIHTGDSYGQRLIQILRSSHRAEGHGWLPQRIRGFEAACRLRSTAEGIRGEVDGILIESKLTGQFNCSNIMGAVVLAMGLGIPHPSIAEGISKATNIPGRFERVENEKGIHIWVDYAHKPDALEKVIITLRELRGNHRLITVFGCGGDRDRKKRPVMGKIAVEGSDYVIITSDNPRTEDPGAIIQEILYGMHGYSNFAVEVDRRKAIFQAIRFAKKGDLVLIAGKGHEDYQILGNQKVPFDDRSVASEACSAD